MIKIYKYENLGHANHGWLDARHHFSFASYYNPTRLGFGNLLVINDDIIAAGRGFATHPHDNMEIITYVRKGAITHKDSMGNIGKTSAGDVQVMSAGTGIYHAEHNHEHEETKLYQIWIKPNKANVTPRWDAKEFPKAAVEGALPVLASGRDADLAAGALLIYQDAAIFGGQIPAGKTITQNIKHNAYILSSEGSFIVNGETLNKGDGAEVTDTKTLEITANTDAEILVIDVN